MIFRKHLNLEGLHAPFSASSSAWLRYDEDKLVDVYLNKKTIEMGTRLHKWAKDTIDLAIRQPRSNKTLYAYVNDAIGFKMETEVVLYYSEYFFGTTDAISFRNNVLRIHDLKTGRKEAKMEQLMIYAALFCLEYNKDPRSIEKIELRIYQNDLPYVSHEPSGEEVQEIMDIIVRFNNLLENVENGGMVL